VALNCSALSSRQRADYDLRGGTHRFRTIQACPKDWLPLPWQAERCGKPT
jgi:hypothetical protein